jgi:hypothetical protein
MKYPHNEFKAELAAFDELSAVAVAHGLHRGTGRGYEIALGRAAVRYAEAHTVFSTALAAYEAKQAQAEAAARGDIPF